MTGLLIGLFFGGTLGFLLACLLTVASRDDEARELESVDPYDFDTRQRRVDRALARENVVPLRSHPRLGIDHATHFDDVFATREDRP